MVECAFELSFHSACRGGHHSVKLIESMWLSVLFEMSQRDLQALIDNSTVEKVLSMCLSIMQSVGTISQDASEGAAGHVAASYDASSADVRDKFREAAARLAMRLIKSRLPLLTLYRVLHMIENLISAGCPKVLEDGIPSLLNVVADLQSQTDDYSTYSGHSPIHEDVPNLLQRVAKSSKLQRVPRT
jgi:hypothetical protein